MYNDMLPVGETATIKPEDIKWNGGDLINRDALKRALNYIYDCAYIDSKSKEGIASDIIAEIDNAPAVDISGNEYFPYRSAYFNGVEDGRATARPQGEWIFKNGKYRCTACGEKAIYRYSGSLAITQTELLTQFCPNCGADMRKGNVE